MSDSRSPGPPDPINSTVHHPPASLLQPPSLLQSSPAPSAASVASTNALGLSAAAEKEISSNIRSEAHTKDTALWVSDQREPHSRSRAQSAHTVSSGGTSSVPPLELTPSTPTFAEEEEQGGKKRGADPRAPQSEPVKKKPRFCGPRSKHTLDSSAFGLPESLRHTFEPPSPLFFSHSPRPRPPLPPRFSSGEAAARMLSKARTEDSHIKTVSLPRGTVATPGPIPTSAPRPDAFMRRSLERSSLTRSQSPEIGSGNGTPADVGAMLNSIGVLELLDQDERPTFIIDLADSANYGPGTLQVQFANSSLRSYAGMYESVSGTARQSVSPGPQTFLQFKAWLLSAAVNGESLNVCLPPFIYAGMTWTCSTLRKRLRIISGAFLPSSPASSLLAPSTSLPPKVEPGSSAAPLEPQDYFGGAMARKPRTTPSAGSDSKGEAVPSIEQLSYEGGGLPGSRTNRQDLSGVVDLMPSPSMYVAPAVNSPSRPTNPSSDSLSSIDDATSQIATVAPEAPSFDWTRLPLTDAMPRHIQFARSVDWASTSLGPIENWSADLRQMCNLIMASPHPAAMYWGDDLIAIYNEAYILLAGQKHPTLMGMSYREAWTEIWDDVKDVFESAKTTGEATMKDDDCLFIKRQHDYLEETYFSWSIIPMVGRDGSVMGLYNPAFEKTRRKIAERRMLTLREVGERTASARDVRGFWAQVQGSFEFNEYDSPFLLLYSVTDELDSDASSIHSSSLSNPRQCILEGTLGVPEGHPAAPDQIDLKSGMEGFGPVFREVMKTDRPVLLEVGSRDLPEGLLNGLHWRGFGDPVRAVVVSPVHPTTGENTLGFLVLGVNPRRPYDDDYSLFVQLLSRQLATSLASVVLFEEEIRRGQRAARLAALDRIELSEQLAARTQEAIESETKFTRMAEFAPVGMFIADSDGRITFANDTWYEISRVPKNAQMADTWMNSVNAEDYLLVKRLWSDLVERSKPVSSEFRFKAQWEGRGGMRGDTWVLFSAYPETHEDGKLKSVFGSLTNISQQKWAESIQTRKMEEAVEMKRQQENFIDMTSHEMRNPLSAILQCSDEISTSLTRFRQSGEQVVPDDLLSSCLDAAQIINLCSQHQKRIVDDILTLSKLDSQLLLVTPVDAQPLTVVQRALKMHEGELQAADIQMKFVVDRSYRDLALDWVRFDPSRVLQVLINLTTNAIKFTGTEKKRTITVTISAFKQRPSDMVDPPVKYFQTRNKREDLLNDGDWGDGEPVFIHFSVQDTGRGLNPEEKKMLFLRFSQASPRTHVQYGGSGLGLFISRELTELQGGEIGVESEAGKGSTFAFYVVARRRNAPPDADPATVTAQSQASKAKAGSKAGAAGKTSSTNGQAARSAVKKVLIVEDNLVNQRVLQKQLKNLGTEVHLANHGGEALEVLEQSTFWVNGSGKTEISVVLMDLEMPVMDGLTAVKRIRELEQAGKLKSHVPIIAVTANARSEQIQTAMDAGMDDVVSKPFRIPELVPKIEDLMEWYPMPSASK